MQQIWVMTKPKGGGWPRWNGGVIGERFRVLNGHRCEFRTMEEIEVDSKTLNQEPMPLKKEGELGRVA